MDCSTKGGWVLKSVWCVWMWIWVWEWIDLRFYPEFIHIYTLGFYKSFVERNGHPYFAEASMSKGMLNKEYTSTRTLVVRKCYDVTHKRKNSRRKKLLTLENYDNVVDISEGSR